MAYAYTRQLQYPVNNYRGNGLKFGAHGIYNGIDWGEHLGEDIICPADTPVVSIGRGQVVYAAFHPGSSIKGNWGNVVIIAYKHPVSRTLFYAVYGHLGVVMKTKGARVDMGETIGRVGGSNTAENGWWSVEHVHFGIYVGIWDGKIFPGYYNAKQNRAVREDWVCPHEFINAYGDHRIKKSKNKK